MVSLPRDRQVRADPPETVNEHSQYNGARPKGESGSLGIDRQRKRVLVGSLTNSYKFKTDGLMKKACSSLPPHSIPSLSHARYQTFSLMIGGVSQHLISYSKLEDVEQGRLRSPSSLPELASLDISLEYLDKTHFGNPPKVEVGVNGIPRYRGEADDIEPSPSMMTVPYPPVLPFSLTDGPWTASVVATTPPLATGGGKDQPVRIYLAHGAPGKHTPRLLLLRPLDWTTCSPTWLP